MFGKNDKLVRFDSGQPRNKRFFIKHDDSNIQVEEGRKKGQSPEKEIKRSSKVSQKSKDVPVDAPDDDLLYVGPEKQDARKIRKKPVLSEDERLDLAVKQKIQEMFMFLFFLVISTIIVMETQNTGAAYLSRAMHIMFVDTPFVSLEEEVSSDADGPKTTPTPAPTPKPAPKPTKPKPQAVRQSPTTPYAADSIIKMGQSRSDDSSTPFSLEVSSTVSTDHEGLEASLSKNANQLATNDAADSNPLVLEESKRNLRMDSPIIESPDLLYKGYDWRGVLAKAKNALVERNLQKSSTIQDVWDFLDTTFINMIYWRYWYSNEDPIAHSEVDDMQVMFSSKLIGVPRIRQVRVRTDSCTIHPSITHYFNSCITYYSSSVEDTSAIRPASTIKNTEPAWKYAQPDETEAFYSYGQVSTYGAGGYYIDLEFTKPLTQKLFLELKQNKWITRSTRAVIIDFTVYNVNANLFVICKFIFETPPTGGMIYNARFEPLKFFRYVETNDYLVLGCEGVFIMFMFYFTAFLTHGLIQGRYRYFKHFGVMLTIVVTLLGWACVGLGIARFFLAEMGAAELTRTHNDTYPNFEPIRDIQADFNKLCSFMLFIAWIRGMLYLKYCQWIQPLYRTIGESENRKALMGLTIIFIVVILALAQLGYLLFGNIDPQFRSFSDAFTFQFSAILGNFNFEEIYNDEAILATLYIILYTFVMFFVLLMLFASVISHSYSIARATVSPIKDRLVSTYICSFIYNVFTCGRKRRTEEENTTQEIITRMKRAGYTDLEIDMFFAKFCIDASSSLAQEQKKKVIDQLELRMFEFESIAVNPHTMANIQDQLDRLTKDVGNLTNDLNANNQLAENLNESINRMKNALIEQKKELDKCRKAKIPVKPAESSKTPARPKHDDDDEPSGYKHELI